VGLDIGCGSYSGRLKEAYSLPQRSIPIIFPWGLRFAQAIVSAPLPQPMSSPTNAVISNYVYHDIAGKDKQALLLETLRVLKKGGTFAIHVLSSHQQC